MLEREKRKTLLLFDGILHSRYHIVILTTIADGVIPTFSCLSADLPKLLQDVRRILKSGQCCRIFY